MTPGAIAEQACHIALVRAAGDAASGLSIRSALVDVRQMRAWIDAQEAGLVGQLDATDSFPEAAIAEASKCSLGQASKTKERADTLATMPTLAGALENGAVTAGHIDAVTRGSKQLEANRRGEFIERVEQLVDIACAGTIEQFSKRLNLEIKQMQSADGEERLTRQRRDVRCASWTDTEGMWNLRGRFDPVTGISLAAKLDHAVEARFAQQTPELCPSDPVEKQKFLTAHALADLVAGSSGTAKPGRAEFVAVIDADVAGRSGPAVDWAIPVEVPVRVLADMIDGGDIHAVVVRNGVVVHAPGETNLGRSTRLANRAQRRALRGLYRGCAVPGCTVGYDRCRLHHIVWWRHGGRTDLDNLLPVCSTHHTNIHHDGWTIELGSRRELTITLADGRVMNTGPPKRSAA